MTGFFQKEIVQAKRAIKIFAPLFVIFTIAVIVSYSLGIAPSILFLGFSLCFGLCTILGLSELGGLKKRAMYLAKREQQWEANMLPAAMVVDYHKFKDMLYRKENAEKIVEDAHKKLKAAEEALQKQTKIIEEYKLF